MSIPEDLSIQLDPFDRDRPLPWRAVEAAFGAQAIEALPHGAERTFGRAWRLAGVGVYAPLLPPGGGDFEPDLTLAEQRTTGGVPTINVSDTPPLDHPFWDAMVTLLVTQPAYLYLGRTPLEALVVSEPDKLKRIPSLFQDTEPKFVCGNAIELRVVISDMARVLAATAGGGRRYGWARAGEVDPDAWSAFEGFITDVTLPQEPITWAGRPFAVAQDDPFEGAYAMLVDWREEDAAIVFGVAERLAEPDLACEEHETGLRLTYRDRMRDLPYAEIGKDRTVTLRALGELLAGDYELRVMERSLGSDGYRVVLAPVTLWQRLDARHGVSVAKLLVPLSAVPGFHG